MQIKIVQKVEKVEKAEKVNLICGAICIYKKIVVLLHPYLE